VVIFLPICKPATIYDPAELSLLSEIIPNFKTKDTAQPEQMSTPIKKILPVLFPHNEYEQVKLQAVLALNLYGISDDHRWFKSET